MDKLTSDFVGELNEVAPVPRRDLLINQMNEELSAMGAPTRDFTEKGNVLERGSRGLTTGVSGVIEGTGAAAEWLGAKEFGKHLREWGKTARLYYQEPDPTFFDNLASSLGSTLVFYPAGIGVMAASKAFGASTALARALGVGASTVLESGVEAGGVYQAGLDKGWNNEKASAAASKTFLSNLVLIGVTNNYGIFNQSDAGRKYFRTLMAAGNEGFQEGMQEVLSNTFSEDPWNQGVWQSTVIGGLIGGGFKGIEVAAEPADVVNRMGKNWLEYEWRQKATPELKAALSAAQNQLPGHQEMAKTAYEMAIQANQKEKESFTRMFDNIMQVAADPAVRQQISKELSARREAINRRESRFVIQDVTSQPVVPGQPRSAQLVIPDASDYLEGHKKIRIEELFNENSTASFKNKTLVARDIKNNDHEVKFSLLPREIKDYIYHAVAERGGDSEQGIRQVISEETAKLFALPGSGAPVVWVVSGSFPAREAGSDVQGAIATAETFAVYPLNNLALTPAKEDSDKLVFEKVPLKEALDALYAQGGTTAQIKLIRRSLANDKTLTSLMDNVAAAIKRTEPTPVVKPVGEKQAQGKITQIINNYIDRAHYADAYGKLSNVELPVPAPVEMVKNAQKYAQRILKKLDVPMPEFGALTSADLPDVSNKKRLGFYVVSEKKVYLTPALYEGLRSTNDYEKAIAVEGLTHELSHHIVNERYFSATQETRDALIAEYEAYLTEKETLESRLQPAIHQAKLEMNGIKETKPDSEERKFKVFHEWLADNVAKSVIMHTFIKQRPASTNIVARFFYEVGQMLKKMYASLKGSMPQAQSVERWVVGMMKSAKDVGLPRRKVRVSVQTSLDFLNALKSKVASGEMTRQDVIKFLEEPQEMAIEVSVARNMADIIREKGLDAAISEMIKFPSGIARPVLSLQSERYEYAHSLSSNEIETMKEIIAAAKQYYDPAITDQMPPPHMMWLEEILRFRGWGFTRNKGWEQVSPDLMPIEKHYYAGLEGIPPKLMYHIASKRMIINDPSWLPEGFDVIKARARRASGVDDSGWSEADLKIYAERSAGVDVSVRNEIRGYPGYEQTNPDLEEINKYVYPGTNLPARFLTIPDEEAEFKERQAKEKKRLGYLAGEKVSYLKDPNSSNEDVPLTEEQTYTKLQKDPQLSKWNEYFAESRAINYQGAHLAQAFISMIKEQQQLNEHTEKAVEKGGRGDKDVKRMIAEAKNTPGYELIQYPPEATTVKTKDGEIAILIHPLDFKKELTDGTRSIILKNIPAPYVWFTWTSKDGKKDAVYSISKVSGKRDVAYFITQPYQVTEADIQNPNGNGDVLGINAIASKSRAKVETIKTIAASKNNTITLLRPVMTQQDAVTMANKALNEMFMRRLLDFFSMLYADQQTVLINALSSGPTRGEVNSAEDLIREIARAPAKWAEFVNNNAANIIDSVASQYIESHKLLLPMEGFTTKEGELFKARVITMPVYENMRWQNGEVEISVGENKYIVSFREAERITKKEMVKAGFLSAKNIPLGNSEIQSYQSVMASHTQMQRWKRINNLSHFYEMAIEVKDLKSASDYERFIHINDVLNPGEYVPWTTQLLIQAVAKLGPDNVVTKHILEKYGTRKAKETIHDPEWTTVGAVLGAQRTRAAYRNMVNVAMAPYFRTLDEEAKAYIEKHGNPENEKDVKLFLGWLRQHMAEEFLAAKDGNGWTLTNKGKKAAWASVAHRDDNINDYNLIAEYFGKERMPTQYDIPLEQSEHPELMFTKLMESITGNTVSQQTILDFISRYQDPLFNAQLEIGAFSSGDHTQLVLDGYAHRSAREDFEEQQVSYKQKSGANLSGVDKKARKEYTFAQYWRGMRYSRLPIRGKTFAGKDFSADIKDVDPRDMGSVFDEQTSRLRPLVTWEENAAAYMIKSLDRITQQQMLNEIKSMPHPLEGELGLVETLLPQRVEQLKELYMRHVARKKNPSLRHEPLSSESLAEEVQRMRDATNSRYPGIDVERWGDILAGFMVEMKYTRWHQAPGFAVRSGGPFERAWIHNSVIDVIQSSGGSTQHGLLDKLRKASGAAKRWIAIWPYDSAMIFGVLPGFLLTMKNPTLAWKIFWTDIPFPWNKKYWPAFMEKFGGGHLAADALKRIDMPDHPIPGEYISQHYVGLKKHGLSVSSYHDFVSNILGEIGTGNPLDRTTIESWQDKAKTFYGANPAVNIWLNNLISHSADILMDGYTKKGMEYEEALERTARFLNTISFLHDPASWGNSAEWLDTIFFAKTIFGGQMKMLHALFWPMNKKIRNSLGIKRRWKGNALAPLANRELTDEQMQMLHEDVFDVFKRAAVSTYAMMAMVQYILSFWDDDEPENLVASKRFIFMNPGSTKFAIRTPMDTVSGGDAYVNIGSWGRFFADYGKYAMSITDNFLGYEKSIIPSAITAKSSVLVRSVIELVSGRTVTGKQIPTDLPDRLKYIFTSYALPLGLTPKDFTPTYQEALIDYAVILGQLSGMPTSVKQDPRLIALQREAAIFRQKADEIRAKMFDARDPLEYYDPRYTSPETVRRILQDRADGGQGRIRELLKQRSRYGY